MKAGKSQTTKKTYIKPELKLVKIRPREVLGTGCHNSINSAGSPECDLQFDCSV